MGYLDVFEIEIRAERGRQHKKFGIQTHPDGTGPERKAMADARRSDCQSAFASGKGTWRHILAEEVFEAFAESDPTKLKTELIQVAAVCKSWIEAINKRQEVSDETSPIHRDRGSAASSGHRSPSPHA